MIRTHRILITILSAFAAIIYIWLVLSIARPHFIGCVKPAEFRATWYGECNDR